MYDEFACLLDNLRCILGSWTYEHAVCERGLIRDRHFGVTSKWVVFKAMKLIEITKTEMETENEGPTVGALT